MVRHLLIETVIGSTLFVLASGVQGQTSRFRDFQDAETLFSQVRTDIERAQHHSFPHFSESDDFDRAKAEVNELESQWEEHRYVPNQTEDVIVAIGRLIDRDHMSSQDRGTLDDDVRKLREFLSSHDR